MARQPFFGPLQEAVDSRDIATLYEFWCFFTLTEQLAEALGAEPRIAMAVTDERGEFVHLTFEASLEAENDGDVIRIEGSPSLAVTLQGTDGDIATVAIAVNTLIRTVEADPGLMTMRDLPIVTWVE